MNRLFKFSLHLIFLVIGIFGGYYFNESSWIKKEKNTLKDYMEIQNKYNKLQKEHEIVERNLLIKVKEEENRYEQNLNSIILDYSNRLRQSEERAELYRNKACDPNGGQESLANHTARLDRSLEEGRYLVRELRETLKYREEQLRILGYIIQNDRNLLKEE